VNSILAAHRRRLLLNPAVLDWFPGNSDVLVPQAGSGVSVTFARADAATCATRVRHDGYIETVAANVPRINYDPDTGERLGLLVEEARLNKCLYSEAFDTGAAWTVAGAAVVADQAVAPDGATSADKLTVAGGDYIYQTISVSASTVYTFSFYIKLGTLTAANFKFAIYDATHASWIAQDIVPTQTPTASGWTRVTYAFTTPAGCVSIRAYGFRYGASAGGTFYLWGAQLEAGGFASSYIKTVASAVTRASDIVSFTGTSFSNWFNSSHGTFLVEGIGPPVAGASDAVIRSLFTVSDNTSANYYTSRRGASSTSFDTLITTASVAQAAMATSGVAASERVKHALAYSATSTNTCRNGTLSTEDTAVSPPTVSRMYVGCNSTGTSTFWCGHIRRIRYFNTRIPDDQLQEMSLAW